MPDPGEALFYDEYSARQHIENVRWPGGAACIRCQSQNVIRMGGRTQAGMLLCRDCRSKFSCRMGTAMEHSHVPLHKWLLALLVATTSQGHLSPQKLKVRLSLGSYRTAWLMTQRIRDALWRHRQELERRGCRGDLNSSSPGRLGLASTRCERGSTSFDDALNALIAYPPRPSDRADMERKRRALKQAPVAGKPPTKRALSDLPGWAASACESQGAEVLGESATTPGDVAAAWMVIAP
jgi:transposase-like protein